MGPTDLLLGAMALVVGLLLAWRSGPVARVALFGSAMVMSALLFLPGEQITGLLGKDGVGALHQFAARTPLDVSEWTHFVIFVWLGLLVWLCRADLRGWKAWGLVVGLAVAAELTQGLAPAREPRVDDVLLNLAGGMAGLLVGVGITVVSSALCGGRGSR
ncbi:VanZ family protein [Luteimonas sp. MC1828]|uniref:VanZ family protein n=1 Tax=Luteimonas sp. MC1828 TaxID=2799787 RepID=UPI0018F12D34|nr:VanZ family protein [Luteimonas sp. MC1828]MBJ7574380.1 VanZ family protein [Luteimonas sp. MC1828]